MQSCHRDIPQHYRGPALIFWVFHAIREYSVELTARNLPFASKIAEYMKVNAKLESATRPYDIVSCHNDWPAANILDAGARPWLIDWDRGGFNSPLFDLGGLAANNSLNEATEQTLLEVYYNARLAAPLLCHESRQPNVRSPVEHAF